MIDKHVILASLRSFRSSITEFDPEEMDYLIDLVERDIELEESISN